MTDNQHVDENQDTTLTDSLADEPREIGHVKWFNSQKGYGFIKRENGSDLFVHFTSINKEPKTLNEHDRVEFTVTPGKKGPEARDVVVLTKAI